jgi:hypothetical protein
MRRTIIINHTAKATYRRAMGALRSGIGFTVGVSLLEHWRGTHDVYNMIGAIGFAVFCSGVNMPMPLVLRHCVLGMIFVSTIVIMDTQLADWLTDEREGKLVAFLSSISPSRWLGLGSPSSSSLNERNAQKRD